MWVFDVETFAFLDVNLAAIALYGYEREEFLQMTLLDIKAVEDADSLSRMLGDQPCGAGYFKGLSVHIKKGGYNINVSVESNAVDFDGRAARVVLITDITEKLKAEEALQFSEKRFKALVQEGADLIAIIDLNLVYKYVSPTSTTVLGIPPENFIGRTAADFIHPEDLPEVSRLAGMLATHHQVHIGPYRFMDNKGEWRWIETRATNLTEDEHIGGIVCNSTDITERMEEEHWLKLLESVVINTTDGVMITDANALDGPKIIYVNDALVQMSGFSRTELVGSSPSIFHAHDDAQEGLKRIENAVHKKIPCTLELVNYTKSGVSYAISMNVCPVTDTNGEVTHWVSIQRDITENRDYIQEIEDQNKRLKTIGWMQSHLVRDPLVRIISLTDILQNGCTGEDHGKLLSYLKKSTAELDAIIQEINKNTNDIAEMDPDQHVMLMNERRFQLFMDELPGLCWIIDRHGILKYANKCFLESNNLTRAVIGKSYEEVFGVDIARIAYLSNQEVLDLNESKAYYQSRRGSSGHLQYFKTYKFPFRDVDGEDSLVGAISFNITERRKLEEELYQSEAQFQQAFEHSLIGMAIISPQGRWERVNSSLCSILGYEASELTNMTIQDITHPDDLQDSMSILKDLASGKISEYKYEKRYVHKDGHMIWVVIAATMLNDSAGEPLHYVSQIEDITNRKHIENDLVLSEKKYRTIFENVQDVFYQTDPQGIITEISPSIEQYSGYPRLEIVGQSVVHFYYYPQDRERIMQELISKGSVIDFEVRLKTKNEELRYASVNARTLIEDGVVKGTEGSMRDVTVRKFQENALKALNTELTASNDQKSKLLSIIGHDLRNPISGSLQLLNLTLMDFESSSAEDVQNYLSMMRAELFNANNLLEDLLAWAKSQFESVSFNPVQIQDLKGLIDKCMQTILPMASKKEIDMQLYVEDGLQVKADTAMLETIIRNLLSNAVKFTQSGGKVLLGAFEDEIGVTFSVKDNGVGIPAIKQEELFNKNSNYTTFGTSGEKGTGLGLSLCFDFVVKHGGMMWVESDEGLGATFYFTLPTQRI